MTSVEKFGQFVRFYRQKKGWTQRELSIKAFDKPRYEFIGRLERGQLTGITFATADKIMYALNSEIDFKVCKKYIPDYIF